MKTREHHHPTSIARRSIGRPILGALLMLLLGVAGIAQPTGAYWETNGTLVSVYMAYQDYVYLVTDDSGGAILFWRGSNVAIGGGTGAVAQRIDRFGSLQWGDNGVDISDPFFGDLTHLSADGNGGVAYTWRDADGVSAQKTDASGMTLWTDGGVEVDGDGVWQWSAPRVLANEDGGAFVAWNRESGHVSLHRISPSGSLMWPEPVTVSGGFAVRMIPDDANGVRLGWMNRWGQFFDNNYVLGQRVDELGNAQWPENDRVISSLDVSVQLDAEIISDGSGGTIFAWDEIGPLGAVWLQRVDANAVALWGANGTNTFPLLTNRAGEQITGDRYGGAIVVVAEQTGDADLYANRVLADGSLAWTVNGVLVCDAPGGAANPQIAPDGFGGAYIVWEDSRYDQSDIFAQHIDADGNLQWAINGAAICVAPGLQSHVQITATGSHDAIVAWADSRNDNADSDLYAQILRYDGTIGRAGFSALVFDPPINEIDVATNTDITVGFAAKLTLATLNSSTITVHGSIGGLYGMSYNQPLGAFTLVMQPSIPFAEGEVVTVVLTDGIVAPNGTPLPPTSWSFTTTSTATAALFPSAVSYGVQNSPTAIYAADINADGAVDLLTANILSNSLSLLKGNGDGTFAPKVDYTTGNGPISILSSDLDLDGDLDVVVLNRDDATLSVFDGRGGSRGLLLAPTSYATGGGPRDVCSGDFNDDGYIDLATANRATDDISVLLNDQTGSFAAAIAYPAGNGSNSIASADLNKDGFLDLVCSNAFSDDVSIFLNLGTGVFAPAVHIPAGDGLFRIQCADVDDDEDIDLIVAATIDDTVILMKNRGDATFAAPIAFVSGPKPRTMRPADIDGDGLLDLVYSDLSTDQLLLRLSDGNGGFGAPASFATGNGPDDVAAADFDGDGDLDLATVNINGDDVTILLNGMEATATEPTPALASTRLWPNVPNPFNPRTEIEYSIAREGHVRLAVYNARGALVTTLVDGRQSAGMQSATWDGVDQDGNSVPSGVYYYRLGLEKAVQTRRMTLIK